MAANPICIVALGVSEHFSQIAHPIWLVVVAVILPLFIRYTAVIADPELERLALTALLDALDVAHLTAKEVCGLLKVSSGQWSEICSGQRHTPSHTRLLNLPWAFWQAYLPSLAFLLTKYKVDNLRSERRSA